ncbi:hypothetical protein B0O99DRAFT_609477 [Bisporella sp. PMI_857]|nr:hypothetical protein B0O99DRAFT_609477 [Bisporella sp. PMI_857]
MDIVLEFVDKYCFDWVYATLFPLQLPSYNQTNGAVNSTHYNSTASPLWEYQPASSWISFAPGENAYMSRLARDNVYRQIASLYVVTWLSGASIYFIVSTLSYIFVFDKTTYQHPKFLKNQIRMEIKQAVDAMPWIAVLTTPFFFAEVRGYSKLYDASADGPGTWYDWFQFPLFLIFTDFCIYFIHRGLHHPSIYKHLHKAHHKWIMPSPYASVAFHPVDGFSQSLPYHLFPFIFPLQKFAYLALFVFVQLWTVMIHDGEYVAKSEIINGAACHTMHHLYFNYNYGQYTTLWDRLLGSYRQPNEELFRRETKMAKEEWERQAKEMEAIVKEVEGEDFRTYDADVPATKLESKKNL